MEQLKKLLMGLTAVAGSTLPVMACTGISLTAKDGSFVHARTIEWSAGFVPCEYVVIPRGQALTSYTPVGNNGLQFTSRYGVVGCAVAQKEFIVEGINEAGLAAGLFYFAGYGQYAKFDSTLSAKTLADLQVVPWLLTQCRTIDEVKTAIAQVRIVSLDPKVASTVHWRISQPDGRQVVLEILDGGVPHFYENEVGVITNSPGFPWQVTNLNNYINLYPGDAPDHSLGDVTLKHIGGSSGMLGLPGDFTSPSRFVRAAFLRNTAPQQPDGFATVTLSFHLLNNFDVPIGLEHPLGKAPDLPSATQWTTATDLTHRRIYYKTAYNNTIRCIDLNTIDFTKVKYQSHLMDAQRVQPVENVKVE